MRCLLALALAGLLVPSAASAQVGVRVQETGENAPRVDGMLRDWRGVRRTRVAEGRDASFEFALARDASGLYIGASVSDDRVVRSSGRSRTEDAIVLTFVLPGRRPTAKEIWLYPGRTGTAAAAASGRLRGRLAPIRGARVVEAQTRHGYEIEAFIPARALGPRWAEGRLALRMNDVDQEARPTVEASPATVTVDPQNLQTLPRVVVAGGSGDALQRFLHAQGIPAAEPSRTVQANVAGDRRAETIAQVGRFVVVYGAGYRDGAGFDFAALPVRGSGGVREFQTRDFTGDGHKELLVVMRQSSERGSRDLWQLFSFTGTAVRPLFGIEVRKQTDAGSVEATVRVRGRRGAPTIEVRAGRARGLSASNFREAPASDAQGILLPWGPVLARSYRWDGERFAVTNERANPHPVAAPRVTTTMGTGARTPATPPAPANIQALVTAARRAERIPRRTRASFSADVNLAEDRTPERLNVFGNSIVVVGTSFRGGNSYFHYAIPGDAGRVLSVSASDLTGDGRAEILIRAAQQLGDVEREVLIVHRFTARGAFPRILMTEVGRRQGDNRVSNRVEATGGRLRIHPGRAQGFNAQSWPWNDAPGESVLLPWRDQPRTYRFTAGQLQ